MFVLNIPFDALQKSEETERQVIRGELEGYPFVLENVKRRWIFLQNDH